MTDLRRHSTHETWLICDVTHIEANVGFPTTSARIFYARDSNAESALLRSDSREAVAHRRRPHPKAGVQVSHHPSDDQTEDRVAEMLQPKEKQASIDKSGLAVHDITVSE